MQHTGRKLKLTPIQKEVLWMLEEAGEENIPTILNTLQATFPHEPHQSLLAQAQTAIRCLWQLQLVSLSRDYRQPNLHSVPLDEAESRNDLLLGEEVEYELSTGKWTWCSNEEVYPIGLVLTNAGRTALTS